VLAPPARRPRPRRAPRRAALTPPSPPPPRARRPQEVLAKVKRLAERVKAEPEVVRTLADLNLPHACCEVVDKGADAEIGRAHV